MLAIGASDDGRPTLGKISGVHNSETMTEQPSLTRARTATGDVPKSDLLILSLPNASQAHCDNAVRSLNRYGAEYQGLVASDPQDTDPISGRLRSAVFVCGLNNRSRSR
jgi:hypothetical protein